MWRGLKGGCARHWCQKSLIAGRINDTFEKSVDKRVSKKGVYKKVSIIDTRRRKVSKAQTVGVFGRGSGGGLTTLFKVDMDKRVFPCVNRRKPPFYVYQTLVIFLKWFYADQYIRIFLENRVSEGSGGQMCEISGGRPNRPFFLAPPEKGKKGQFLAFYLYAPQKHPRKPPASTHTMVAISS